MALYKCCIIIIIIPVNKDYYYSDVVVIATGITGTVYVTTPLCAFASDTLCPHSVKSFYSLKILIKQIIWQRHVHVTERGRYNVTTNNGSNSIGSICCSTCCTTNPQKINPMEFEPQRQRESERERDTHRDTHTYTHTHLFASGLTLTLYRATTSVF